MTEEIFPGVELGEGTVVEPGARIGVPPRGAAPGEVPTIIGPGSRIRSGTVIYAGARIGARFQSGHGAMIRENNVIGDGCSVGTNAVLEPGNRIGDGSRVHSHCFLENVTLGRRVFLKRQVRQTTTRPPWSRAVVLPALYWELETFVQVVLVPVGVARHPSLSSLVVLPFR